jgi:DNA-binding beta-propeller fold protein YncE
MLRAALVLLVGCVPVEESNTKTVLVWGKRGLNHGRFQKPRALAIDARDQLFIADKTGFIQKFDRAGTFLKSWRLPDFQIGLPCGLSISNDGNLLVADTHYFRVLTYSPDGELLAERTIGGRTGRAPGQFGFVTDVVQDRAGNFYVSEYGDNDRIQKFDPSGKFLLQIGAHGSEPGEFLRPQSLAFDGTGQLWVADACNHRIQVFDVSGAQPKLVKILGHEGTLPGELRYPYSIAFNAQGDLYVCEMGNHRIQHWRTDGTPIETWGTPGKGPGQFNQPWAIAFDSEGFLHILDTHNHRVQRVKF